MVKVKGDDALSKIAALEKGGSGGGRGGAAGATSGGGGVFQKIQNNTFAQVAQLAGISGGILGLTAVMTKASGHLQATFKLWETSMLLIFRPFGDFVGMVFRPFALAMLGVAMPFYREGAKWFQQYGRAVGESLLSLSGVGRQQQVERTGEELGLAPDEETKKRAQAAYNEWVEFFESLNPFKFKPRGGEFELTIGEQERESILNQLERTFTNFGMNIQSRLLGIPPMISKVFLDFGANVWNHLVGIPQLIGGVFTTFGQNLFNGIVGVPNMIVDVFSGLASNLTSTLSNIPQLIWNAIMAMWNSAKGNINSQTGTNLPAGSGTPVAPAIRRAQLRTQIAGIADTLE